MFYLWRLSGLCCSRMKTAGRWKNKAPISARVGLSCWNGSGPLATNQLWKFNPSLRAVYYTLHSPGWFLQGFLCHWLFLSTNKLVFWGVINSNIALCRVPTLGWRLGFIWGWWLFPVDALDAATMEKTFQEKNQLTGEFSSKSWKTPDLLHIPISYLCFTRRKPSMHSPFVKLPSHALLPITSQTRNLEQRFGGKASCCV